MHAGDALLVGEECVGDVEADYFALLLPRAEVEVEGRKLVETAAFYRLPVDFQTVFFSVERVRHGGEVSVELDDLLFYPLSGVLGEEAVVYFGEPGVEFGKGCVHSVELAQRVFVFALEAVLFVQLVDQLFKVLESVPLYDEVVQSSLFAEKFVQLLAPCGKLVFYLGQVFFDEARFFFQHSVVEVAQILKGLLDSADQRGGLAVDLLQLLLVDIGDVRPHSVAGLLDEVSAQFEFAYLGRGEVEPVFYLVQAFEIGFEVGVEIERFLSAFQLLDIRFDERQRRFVGGFGLFRFEALFEFYLDVDFRPQTLLFVPLLEFAAEEKEEERFILVVASEPVQVFQGVVDACVAVADIVRDDLPEGRLLSVVSGEEQVGLPLFEFVVALVDAVDALDLLLAGEKVAFNEHLSGGFPRQIVRERQRGEHLLLQKKVLDEFVLVPPGLGVGVNSLGRSAEAEVYQFEDGRLADVVAGLLAGAGGRFVDDEVESVVEADVPDDAPVSAGDLQRFQEHSSTSPREFSETTPMRKSQSRQRRNTGMVISRSVRVFM